MTLVSYEPKNWMDKFFESGSLPARGFADPFFGAHAGDLKVNIVEEKDHFNLTAEVPGWQEEDIELEIHNDTLTLRGQAEKEKKEEKDNYRMREFVKHSFERSFRLGSHIDQEKVSAKLDNGVLHVRLPKREEAKPKSVKVNIGG